MRVASRGPNDLNYRITPPPVRSEQPLPVAFRVNLARVGGRVSQDTRVDSSPYRLRISVAAVCRSWFGFQTCLARQAAASRFSRSWLFRRQRSGRCCVVRLACRKQTHSPRDRLGIGPIAIVLSRRSLRARWRLVPGRLPRFSGVTRCSCAAARRRRSLSAGEKQNFSGVNVSGSR